MGCRGPPIPGYAAGVTPRSDAARNSRSVNRVTEPGGALEAAAALAELVCRNAPVSVRQSLWALEQTVAADDQVGWDATAQATAAVRATDDNREGRTAFFEKRAPNWQGR